MGLLLPHGLVLKSWLLLLLSVGIAQGLKSSGLDNKCEEDHP